MAVRRLFVPLFVALGACDASSNGGAGEDPGPGITTVADESSSGESSAGESSAGESSSDDGAPMWCGDAEITLVPATPQVMLVLDKSHSMVSNRWDHDGDATTADVTRWQSLHGVVAELAGELDGSLELGALLFPSVALTSNDAATACDVPGSPDVAVGLGSADAIVGAMPPASSEEIWGGTPTRAAIATAAAELRTLAGAAPKAIVLVTDGAANCMDGVPSEQIFTRYDDDLAPLVAATFADDGIPTYVVGIDIVDAMGEVPQANPYERLGEVALAGGAPRAGDEAFYNTRDEAELALALGSITAALQCTVALADVPTAPSRVHLVVDGEELAYSADCEDEGGWRYAEGGGAVELCSAACDDFVALGTLHAGFDCMPEP